MSGLGSFFYILNMDAIKLENVSFRYPRAAVEALSQVNLQIPQGSFFALLGPNGAGKTTLLRLLCGRFASYEGTLNIAEGFRGPNGFLDPKSYGILLENPGVYPKLSVEEYVKYFAGMYGCGECGTRLQSLARDLELPALSTKLSALSLGNRQKVQILRALIHNPKLLILDEPVANLDPMSRETVWRLIADWRKRDGGTAIVCSHILAEMDQEATDYAIVNHGKILKAGAAPSNAHSPLQKGKNFDLSFEQDVSQELIQRALESAGLPSVSIRYAGSSLADIYKENV
ncbi:ABC transporter ATP-binding protein [Fibrobacter sp. UWH1]|uniref:ABC transporter ATP-binding protein n=2 Tax=unclassified Fibrobacter TaxID=2634177 RepID=UPI0020CE8197|nr:ABC transporter ATP-binding protein [Fibrobacter sp. UWH1]